MKKFYIGLLAGFLIAAVAATVIFFAAGLGEQHDVQSEQTLISAATEAVEYISSGDYEGLSGMVHPVYGVVFTPYSTVNLTSDKCFTPAQVAAFGSDSTSYVWGTYDGSGGPIEMTVADYFSSFVYNADYAAAPVIGVDYVVRYGNALENVSEVFPDARFVDLHFPSLTGNRDTGDWSTLRLVFEEYDGELMLTAVIHCEPTV